MGCAREGSKREACRSNLKSISLAMRRYAEDYDGFLPPAQRWCDASLDAINNANIIQCPSLPGSDCGYDLNWALSSQKLHLITNPKDVPMVFDGSGRWNGYGGEPTVEYRHVKTACFGFVDGHGVWHTPEETAALSWRPRFDSAREAL
jgi:hypothetical protein